MAELDSVMSSGGRQPRLKPVKFMPSFQSSSSTSDGPEFAQSSSISSRPNPGNTNRLQMSLDDDDEDEGILNLAQTLEKLAVSSEEAATLREEYDAMAAARRRYHKAVALRGDTAAMRKALEDARDRLEEELWPVIRDCVDIGLETPQLLVVACKIMEELDALHASLHSSSGGAGGDESGSDDEGMSLYVSKCHKELEKGAKARFRDLQERGVKKSSIKDIVEEADSIASDLFIVAEKVGPAFPECFKILPHLRQVYMDNYAEVGRRLSTRIIKEKDKDPVKVNQEISEVMSWAHALRNRMVTLGLDKELADAHQESGSLDPLVDEYVARMSTFLGPALERIMDMELGKGVDGEDPLRTDLPPEIFRWLHAQVEQAEKCANSRLLAKVGAAMAKELCGFQNKYIELLRDKFDSDPELEDGDLMVSTNDCFTLRDFTVDMANDFLKATEPQHHHLMDFKPAINGFKEHAREAARLGVRKYLQDGGHFDKSRFVDVSLMEELDDMFKVWREWLKEEAFPVAVEVCLEVLVVICVEEFLCLEEAFTPDSLSAIIEEREALEVLFGQYVDEDTLDDRLQILRNLADIGFADAQDTFVVACESLLVDTWPRCPLKVAEHMLSLHEFNKEERNWCMERCKSAWEEHLAKDPAERRDPGWLKLGYAKFRPKKESGASSQQETLSSLLSTLSLSGR